MKLKRRKFNRAMEYWAKKMTEWLIEKQALQSKIKELEKEIERLTEIERLIELTEKS